MAGVDTSGLEGALRDLSLDLIDRLGDRFIEKAQEGVSRRSGRLHDSIQVVYRPALRSDGASVVVGAETDYARFQDEGTGIYGPEGRPITPTRGKVLVFDWPAAGGIVFARSVRGSEPTRFWTKAVEAWPSIVRDAAR